VQDEKEFHIVLGHAPDFALGNVQGDLFVAGHTHGGQVRLPIIGPIITFSRVPRHMAAGVTELAGGRTLVVSRGTGMERGYAPRMRFLCRPELVVIEIAPR
jgi:predicted MPP superfamily phosphohydrolase